MKIPRDRFSKQSAYYKKYRPEYPAEFIHEIVSLVENKNNAWDCGTGTGQVAQQLSTQFNKVFATDISENQISKAEQNSNILYSVARAEDSGFTENTFDLITVAQAVHWFDFEHFNKEARRVSVNGGILALWGYNLLRVDPVIDPLIDYFYEEILGEYWDAERRHVEDSYAQLPFPFQEIQLSQSYFIEKEFNLYELLGYFNSWSAVQNYSKATNSDPVAELQKELLPVWGKDKLIKTARFPIFYRIGRIEK